MQLKCAPSGFAVFFFVRVCREDLQLQHRERREELLEAVTLADTVKPKAKKELGTKNEQRARRKMQLGRGAPKEEDYPALPPQDSNILTPDQPKTSFA